MKSVLHYPGALIGILFLAMSSMLTPSTSAEAVNISLTIGTGGSRQLQFSGSATNYYVLYRSNTVTNLTNAVITGVPSVFNLVEGTALSVSDSATVEGSLCRLPNGNDTNNADDDWAFSTTLTPGAANQP